MSSIDPYRVLIDLLRYNDLYPTFTDPITNSVGNMRELLEDICNDERAQGYGNGHTDGYLEGYVSARSEAKE